MTPARSRRSTSCTTKDFNNFGPRVSRLWDIAGTGKTVVRAGWGLYYDAFSQDFFVGQLPWNTFNPGPAYNDIEFSFSPVVQIEDGQPVFEDFSSPTCSRSSPSWRRPTSRSST